VRREAETRRHPHKMGRSPFPSGSGGRAERRDRTKTLFVTQSSAVPKILIKLQVLIGLPFYGIFHPCLPRFFRPFPPMRLACCEHPVLLARFNPSASLASSFTFHPPFPFLFPIPMSTHPSARNSALPSSVHKGDRTLRKIRQFALVAATASGVLPPKVMSSVWKTGKKRLRTGVGSRH